MHSTFTGLSPLLEKVCFSCLVVSKEASVAQKANKVMKCLKSNTFPEQCSKGTVEGYVIEHDFIFKKFVQISFFLTSC